MKIEIDCYKCPFSESCIYFDPDLCPIRGMQVEADIDEFYENVVIRRRDALKLLESLK